MMRKSTLAGLATLVLCTLAGLHAIASNCGDCGEQDCYDCNGLHRTNGVGNHIDVGVVADDLDGNRQSFDQYGLYPSDWYTSGKLFCGADSCSKERFELRWQDALDGSGRLYTRLSLWPATLEADSFIIGGNAWQAYAADPVLVSQEAAFDSLRLRYNEGGLDDLLLSYDKAEFNREDPLARLKDFSFERTAAQYNFELGCDMIRGQARQTHSTIDSPRQGVKGAEIDTTMVKLDARMSDEFSAFGKLSASTFSYDHFADDKMASSDYTLGLRFRPDQCWEFSSDYRSKNNADDNTASTHVQRFDEFGLGVTYLPCDGGVYEAGFRHRNVDYERLDVLDAGVSSVMRASAVAGPKGSSAITSLYSPEYDTAYIGIKHDLSDDLVFRTRIDYSEGDTPGTVLVNAGSPSLFYDKLLTRSHGLTYSADCDNQFDLNLYGQESSNGARESDFDMSYTEGSWIHSMGPHGSLVLAVRNTETQLDAADIAEAYTTDDLTYTAGYSQDLCDFSYGLNLSVSDGSGAEEYTQTGLGANFDFKSLGPVGMRIDWYDRSYTNFPGIDAQALAVSVTYRLEF